MTNEQAERKLAEDTPLKDLADELVRREEALQAAKLRERQTSIAETAARNDVAETESLRDRYANALQRKLGKVPGR